MKDENLYQENTHSIHSEVHSSIAPGEIIIGTIVSIDNAGKPLVNFLQNPRSTPIIAMSTAPLTQQHISRQVALLFNNGDLSHPIIIGLIHSPLDALLENVGQQEDTKKVELAGELNLADVKVEGKKMTFEAQDEMIFKCGDSSITLTKAGKVMIRGKYLLNRSSGVNRIMGGSVQVN